MAGIGFELKKIFKGGGLLSTVYGAVYATAVTVGPMVSIIAVLMLLYRMLDFLSLTYAQRELLTGAVMYVFIFSMIITSPINGILSRYVADRLYTGERDAVLPSFYVGLALNVVIGAAIAVPFGVNALRQNSVEPVFMLSAYMMFMSLLCTFFCMTYVSALKNYRSIGNAFLWGLLSALAVGYGLFRLGRLDTSLSILIGMAFGFTVITMLLLVQVRSAFRGTQRSAYKETRQYFRRFQALFFCSLFYALGLYAHNFVVWYSDLGIVVGGVFRVAPVYDAATCYAMFTNVSALVLFVVQVETRFYEKYRGFCDALNAGGGEDILHAKRELFRSMAHEIGYMLQIQMLITVSLYVLFLLLLPLIGVTGLTMEIYPMLAVAFLVIYMMYMLLVFMFYLNDHAGALLTTASFLLATLLGSVLATRYLPQSLYGAGAFAGAFIGWTVGFFRLRWLERNFEQHVFCDIKVAGI